MKFFPLCAALVLAACGGASDSEVAEMQAPAMSMPEPPQGMMDEAARGTGPTTAAQPNAAYPPNTGAPTDTTRRLIRRAEVRLRVGDYPEARQRVAQVVRQHGAYVGGEQEQHLPYEVSNTLIIRVDARRFEPLLDALTALGEEVESRHVSVDDVTAQYVDLEARLRARRAVEQRYLAILGNARSVEDVLAVETKLAEVREAIESAEGQLRLLQNQVALSTITLTIFERSATGITEGPSFWSRIGNAFEAGWEGLLALIVGAVAAWPLWLLGGLALWLLVRFGRSRRKQPPVPHPPAPSPPAS
ncbi:MAG TPA: DUF4349 domain-containing protein [Rubricoccaceae bacterium]|nr:DUF4349 domain-containing protein [Rubricoccaceae bacterium]